MTAHDLAERLEGLGMPPAVRARAHKEVSRLEQIPSASPEMGMVRTWIDWLLDLPWGERPSEHIDIERAAAILDEDHFGLSKVKDRILEWMAVRDRAQRRAAQLADAAATADLAADAEPSARLAEVNRAIGPLESVTGADAGGADGTHAASQSLIHEAQQLAGLLDQFIISDEVLPGAKHRRAE